MFLKFETLKLTKGWKEEAKCQICGLQHWWAEPYTVGGLPWYSLWRKAILWLQWKRECISHSSFPLANHKSYDPSNTNEVGQNRAQCYNDLVFWSYFCIQLSGFFTKRIKKPWSCVEPCNKEANALHFLLFLIPVKGTFLNSWHLLIYFLKITLVNTQFRVHGFVPESCYLCACCWNLCVCYIPGHCSVTHAGAWTHKFQWHAHKTIESGLYGLHTYFYLYLTTWK